MQVFARVMHNPVSSYCNGKLIGVSIDLSVAHAVMQDLPFSWHTTGLAGDQAQAAIAMRAGEICAFEIDEDAYRAYQRENPAFSTLEQAPKLSFRLATRIELRKLQAEATDCRRMTAA